jgi:imidazolonepropionase-like amidohydrolase
VIKHPNQPVELDLFSEMQAFISHAPGCSPESLLRMVTLNPALALGRSGEFGELARGALADLIAVPYAGDAAQAAEAVVHHRGPVSASLIDGKWAVAPPA